MKILMICNTDGALYVFRKPIIDRALADGHDVAAVSGDSTYTERLRTLGVRMYSLNFARHSAGILDNLRLFFGLLRVIRHERPDVVHGFTHKPAILGTVAARISGVRNILVTITGLGSLFIRNDLKSRILRQALLWQYRFALRFAKCVFFQNPDDLLHFTDSRVVSANRAALTHGSGLNLSDYQIPSNSEYRSARLSIELELNDSLDGKHLVLLPARGIREKGLFEYYEAARILNELEPERYVFLHLGLVDSASSGSPSADDILTLARKTGVRYLGFKDDIGRYMRATDIVVLPSYREGTPRALMEALALGKCIVTTDAPGCRETVLNGWNGWLCAVGSSSSLVACLLRCDAHFIRAAKMRSRALCEAKYDARQLVELTLRKYALDQPSHH